VKQFWTVAFLAPLAEERTRLPVFEVGTHYPWSRPSWHPCRRHVNMGRVYVQYVPTLSSKNFVAQRVVI